MKPRVIVPLVVSVILVAAGLAAARIVGSDIPGFREQACALPRPWLRLTQRGHYRPRSGQIAVLPRTPAYQASGRGGWSHSGPWSYLQDIPLVFYGPRLLARPKIVDAPATLADVAPTVEAMIGGRGAPTDGRVLRDVVRGARTPRLVLVIVWDGAGWNVLRRYPDAWPNLARTMQRGISYANATVGSSPSVTPAVHSTLGTGVWPRTHGISGVPVRDEKGEVVDAFLDGESSRFLRTATLAERWDESHGNRPLIGMVGYEPWHLGMIGKGAERPGGDRDHAVWLDRETNEWITNPRHYSIPKQILATGGLQADVTRLDVRDGARDGAWGRHSILDDPARLEETPAFVVYHARVLQNLIRGAGYGDDKVTDLLFTNFKQVDRVGHYFNMESEEVRALLVESDRQLGVILDFLETDMAGRYLVVVTADHGQQPDAPTVDGYGIDPRALESDIDRKFGGPIARAVWPTEVFLREKEMARLRVSVADVARYIGGYRLVDNTDRPLGLFKGHGQFRPLDRLYDLAIPARMLPGLRCGTAAQNQESEPR